MNACQSSREHDSGLLKRGRVQGTVQEGPKAQASYGMVSALNQGQNLLAQPVTRLYAPESIQYGFWEGSQNIDNLGGGGGG